MNELIIKAINGDKDSFIKAILKIEKDLYVISKARLKNEDDICDAIQETVLEAFSNIHKLRDLNLFKTWIIKILINKCNYIYKNNKKYNISFEDNELENYICFDNNISQNSNIDFLLLIKDLTSQERLIITLYYYNEFTSKEISKLLKLNENTIRSKISRAKLKIKEKYRKELFNG